VNALIPALQLVPIIVVVLVIIPVQDIATQPVLMPAKELVPAAVKTSVQEDARMNAKDVLLVQAHVTQTAVEDVLLNVMHRAMGLASPIVAQTV
jgi:hypothetical protein